MPPFSESEARALLERVMGLSQAEGCAADLQATRSGNIRFARNAVSTSGVTDDATLTVQSRYGRKTGTAQVNQFDDESLTRTVRRAEELARLAPEDPEVVPLLEPQHYAAVPAGFVDATAAVTPEFRADAAAASIAAARQRAASPPAIWRTRRAGALPATAAGCSATTPTPPRTTASPCAPRTAADRDGAGRT